MKPEMVDEVKVVEVVEKPDEARGGRNLTILGLVSVALAIVVSAVSLWIYHATGDIYLDRSRPGFITEDGEGEKNATDVGKSYVFSADGAISGEVLDGYLKELDKVDGDIKDASGAFSADALSDEALGIVGGEEN